MTAKKEDCVSTIDKLSNPLLGLGDCDEAIRLAHMEKARRYFCQCHRSIMKSTAAWPSSNIAFLTENGRASPHSLVKDVCLFMSAVVNEMETEEGISTSLETIQTLTGLPFSRVRACYKWSAKRGWLSDASCSTKYKDLIVKVSPKYFYDLGVEQGWEEALCRYARMSADRKALKELWGEF
ncbi:hypothetical protein [Vibrio neptunius]|uniref:hypothetical protein n=1 Tax=Vibrio neptunius TaxID=170651 RepID=UPI003CE59578